MNKNSQIVLMETYDEIKQNIINNFLNPGYRYATVYTKRMVIGKILAESCFPITYDEGAETITFNLGNDVSVTVKLLWEDRSTDESHFYLKGFE